MKSRSSKTRETLLAAALLGLLHGGGAIAEEGKIYKHVDEKGSVVYSQVPPTTGKVLKKLDSKPAYTGLGGYGPPVWPYGDTRGYSEYYGQDPYRGILQQRQQQMDAARSKRLAELEAECNRNRGTDCKDPEALRYIESTKIPRMYRR